MFERLQLFLSTVRAHIRPIFYRNTVTLTNIIFTAVTLLLLVFGELQEALFMFSIVVLNSLIGTVQDLRAKIALERLQILMTPKVKRLRPSGDEEIILLEDIRLHDQIKIELGDQIPADGTIVENHSLEVNEALLTGESSNIGKNTGSTLLAGSFVMAGWAVVSVGTLPADSYVSRMTSKLKEYKLQLSPIQRTLTLFIQYMTYVLIGIIIYVLIQGISGHELVVSIVKDIAALTGTLVPQGLILATTIFFAYGAIKLFKKQVLLQEINATEKLGRIKNLCVDKTGTLTENIPTMERVEVVAGFEKGTAEQLILGYFTATSDASHTAKTIEKSISSPFSGAVSSPIPFSSSRKFGAARVNIQDHTYHVVTGAPDILLRFITDPKAREWVERLLQTEAPKAKRLLLLTTNAIETTEGLEQARLTPVAMFILANPLRSGIPGVIQFFQDKGTRVRVISGDNPETVKAIALEAGIKYADMAITGPEMDDWDSQMYTDRVPAYNIFARIKPEQKEKIVEILKTHGFTAMVGDGANDALALKKSDLGIAMFEGSSATRSIAQIVLMNNSFTALPTGVTLAENIISNIELVASVFFNKVAVGLLLFIALASLGHSYPLSPRNITVISYLTIGLPIFYWAIWPVKAGHQGTSRPFLRRILPYSLLQSIIITAASVSVFLVSPRELQTGNSNALVALSLMTLGFGFFLMAPIAYTGKRNAASPKQFWIATGAAGIMLLLIFLFSGTRSFFDLHLPPLLPLFLTLAIISCTLYIQYSITKRWFS